MKINYTNTTEIISLGSAVTIIDADIVGRVDAIMQEYSGISYRVRWWQNGSRVSMWFLQREITSKY